MTELLERVAAGLAERYIIEREVGRGGMASVFLAQDRKHGRPVAVKVLRPEIAGGLGTERFLLEIQIAAHLNHPNVLPLLDSGEAEGLLYYVMPFVEGETLRERLTRAGQLSLEDSLQITREVAEGLAYAHSRGLVHRDIKPENIMLSSGHAVITDFGIARAINQAGDERLTRTGIAGGTPSYMSPEQWSGAERIDGRTDLYSLACVLYEMLVGEPPFTGPSAQVLMARHLQATLPSVRVVRPSVPEQVDAAITRALAKVPVERFDSVHDFAMALAAPDTTAPDTAQRLFGRSSMPSTGGPGRTVPVRPPPLLTYAAIALFLLIGAFMAFQWFVVPELEAAPIRIAVLPFEDLGPPQDDYFADGMTEEMIGRLASIGSLRVIARSSVLPYKNTSKPIGQIGEELDVAYLVTGSVGHERTADGSGRNIRVRVRLVKVADDTQAWGESYQVALAGVFEVQSNIAERVARALNVVLLEPERQRLAAHPTANMEAYDYYLQGNSYYNRSWARADVERALALYERAAELDPSFALAFAQIARMQVWMYRLRYGSAEERLVASKQAADRAVALDPDLAEGRISMGLYHYWGQSDYEAAIAQLMAARSVQPGNAEVHRQIGNIRRRQGMFEAAIENYQRAAELDPRSHINSFNLGDTFLFIRQYAEAAEHLDRTIALNPEFSEAYVQRARLELNRDGNIMAARRILEQGNAHIPLTRWRSNVLQVARIAYEDFDEQIEQAALGAWGLDTMTIHLRKAEVFHQAGRRAEARLYFDSARIALEALRAQDPDEAWIHGYLGMAYAGLGRREEAMHSARRAIEIVPLSRDALSAPEWLINLARVHTMLGERDAAIDQLAFVLTIPAWVSPAMMGLDPTWKPLRDHPRFRRLAAMPSGRAPTGAAEAAPPAQR
ncbi:serine/threonine-protein kinase [soil metagenome]